MNKIFYFSGSGKSRRLAEYLGKVLDFPVIDINKIEQGECSAETAVVVFPVYCQNLPDPIKDFLPKLNAKNIVFAATYGKKSFGNIIYDAAQLVDGNVIAGVCVPCGHSFLEEPDDFDFEALSPFIERIKNPKNAVITKAHKDFYADLIPAQRTRIGVKITKNKNCISCGKCAENCPMCAIENNKINKNCIRCLGCVSNCPEHALSVKTLWFMKIYLKAVRKNKIQYYL